jgi:hypothetical protein
VEAGKIVNLTGDDGKCESAVDDWEFRQILGR